MRIVGKVAVALVAIAALGGGAFWIVTMPSRLDAAVLASLPQGDAGRGERIFHAAGCASCHGAAQAEADDRPQLTGGLELRTPFGTFIAPNISTDPEDGIGGWTVQDFANAVMRGVSPDGRHYYPAFPYTSYARMKPDDVADLFAFMGTLPPVKGKAAQHRLAFPFNVRRGIGAWKLLNLDPDPLVTLADAPEAARQGQYLVEGPGHCGECHTPRDFMGGTIRSRWLAGAPAAAGDGNVPNITSGEGGIGDWSESDIAYYLESGFTPDFDSVGGEMVKVQQNMAKLSPEDRAAIAAYLKAVPPQANGYSVR
jgi:mono/diheme cytochrome c family protein